MSILSIFRKRSGNGDDDGELVYEDRVNDICCYLQRFDEKWISPSESDKDELRGLMREGYSDAQIKAKMKP